MRKKYQDNYSKYRYIYVYQSQDLLKLGFIQFRPGFLKILK